jgi:hypothetical protein
MHRVSANADGRMSCLSQAQILASWLFATLARGLVNISQAVAVIWFVSLNQAFL